MIISFFSHKGGVGRTMAIANIAWLLIKKGKKVIMMDWDFESPGLENFFRLSADKFYEHPGFMELMDSFSELNKNNSSTIRYPEINDFLYNIQTNTTGKLQIIHPGRRSIKENVKKYVKTVSSNQFIAFYNEYHSTFFNWMYNELKDNADYVLIDERTGFSHTSAIGNFHMADLVLLFSSTSTQNFDGLAYMLERFKNPDLQQKRNNRKIETLIVPSRFDTDQTEPLMRFATDFYHKFEKYLIQDVQSQEDELKPDKYLYDLGIPYLGYYSFNDIIAVKEGKNDQNYNLWLAYNRLLARIERTYWPDVFIYYCEQDKDSCELIVSDLKTRGIKVWVDFDNKNYSNKTFNDILENSRFFLVLYSKDFLKKSENYKATTIETRITEASQNNQSIVLLLDDTKIVDPYEKMISLDLSKQDKDNPPIYQFIKRINFINE